MKKLIIMSAILCSWGLNVANINADDKTGIWYESYKVDFVTTDTLNANISSISLNNPSEGEDGSSLYHDPCISSSMEYAFPTDLNLKTYVANNFHDDCYNAKALELGANDAWPTRLYFYIKGSFTVTLANGITTNCPFIVGMGYHKGGFNWWISAANSNTLSEGMYLPCYDQNNICGFIEVSEKSGPPHPVGIVDAINDNDSNNTFYLTSFVTQLPYWASGTSGHPSAQLNMQSDGNLVIYDINSDSQAIWASGTSGHPSAQLNMQSDGNLVIYDHVNPATTMIWHTNTGKYTNAEYGMSGGDFVIESFFGNSGSPDLVWQSPTHHKGVSYKMQTDGNFVVCDENDNVLWGSNTAGHPNAWFKVLDNGDFQIWWNNPAIWASNTGGRPEGDTYRLEVQNDGNLTIIDTTTGQNIWYSGSGGHPMGNCSWIMQNDGNLVVYGNNPAIWASNTGGRPEGDTYRLEVQNDGNLTIIDTTTGQNIWYSGSGGHPMGNYSWVMQNDGNLVVYGNSQEIWSTHTGGRDPKEGPFTKVMQSDGNLVIYDGHGNAIWATDTGGSNGLHGAWDVFQTDGNYVIYWGDKTGQAEILAQVP